MIGFVVAAGTAAVLSAAGWNSMAPRSQLYGRTFIGVNGGSKLLALTYDDGPTRLWTPRLLEVLARHGVHATFFMMGNHVALSPDVARDVAAAGHVIGNHSYTHPNLIFSSRTQILAQLEACRRVLQDTIGQHSDLFRPPFGGRRPDVLSLARRQGYVPVMWSVTAYDWNADPPSKIEGRIVHHVRGGDVILMHDGSHASLEADRSATIAATDRIIRRYKDQGYRFVTVPEMMQETDA